MTDQDRKREIGERLRAIRERQDMSQTDVAKAVGAKNGSWIGNLEIGKRSPNSLTLIRLAGALDVDLHWLLTGDAWEPRG